MQNVKRIAVASAFVTGIMFAAGAVQALPASAIHGSQPGVLGAQGAKSDAPGVYFISPQGDDDNPGTKSAPFKTLMRAQEAATAGDTVYIRGGVYNQFEIPETDNPHESLYHFVHDIYKSGITYQAFEGDERPVFDFSAVPTDQRVAAFYIGQEVTNVSFAGLDVTGVKVGDQKQSEAFRIAGGANFENMAAYGNEANGFYFTANGTGVVLNTDAYDNVGPTRASAGNTDGFGAHAKDVWFINTRAWGNSDDGFDSISSSGRVAYVNSWAFNHQGNRDGVGDKNGFKVGGYSYRTEGLPDPLPVHTVIGSLAVGNGANNFYANHQPGQSAYWLNNTADRPGHGSNFNLLERLSPSSPENIAGFREVLHNNIAFNGPATSNDATPAEKATNNSWTINGGIDVSAEEFMSLDAGQLTAPRTNDGSLPEVTYLKPVAGSALQAHGLGYLADAEEPCSTLHTLVEAYTASGDIDNRGVSASLQSKLQERDLPAFAEELASQSGRHVSPYAAETLALLARTLAW